MEPMYYDVPTHLTHQLMTWMKTFVNDNDATNIIHVREVANHMRFSSNREGFSLAIALDAALGVTVRTQ